MRAGVAGVASRLPLLRLFDLFVGSDSQQADIRMEASRSYENAHYPRGSRCFGFVCIAN
jgi:hypothetical protein